MWVHLRICEISPTAGFNFVLNIKLCVLKPNVNKELQKSIFLKGWMDVKAVLRIAYSNQKLPSGLQSVI